MDITQLTAAQFAAYTLTSLAEPLPRGFILAGTGENGMSATFGVDPDADYPLDLSAAVFHQLSEQDVVLTVVHDHGLERAAHDAQTVLRRLAGLHFAAVVLSSGDYLMELPPSSAAGQGEVAAEDIELWYPNVDRFLHEFLLPSWRHTTTARWCRKWYLHAEAVSRLDALWRAYEALRVGDPTGMAVWWRDYADPTMASLTSTSGTFAGCDFRRDQHQPMAQWLADHAPAVTVPDEGVLRPKAAADIID